MTAAVVGLITLSLTFCQTALQAANKLWCANPHPVLEEVCQPNAGQRRVKSNAAGIQYGGIMEKGQIEKEIRKYKWFIFISILGLIFSIFFIIYFYINNDNRLVGFGAILFADIYELQRDVRRYLEAKRKLD